MEATTVSKKIDASAGQHPGKGARGLYDSAAKGIVSTRSILAWIVKFCVTGAESLTIDTIATQCIAREIIVSAVPVRRDDADAQTQDPGDAHMESTEDSSVTEGVVRYDILFTLKLPGQPESITVIVNVELQNRIQLEYPLASRGVCYAARLLGRQGTNYGNLHKVYSIWIVSNPPKREKNTVVRLQLMKTVNEGAPQKSDSAADLMEVCFLNLGDPNDVRDTAASDLLRLLDIVFDKAMSTGDKKALLENEFAIPMTKTMEDDIMTMAESKYAFEFEAEVKLLCRMVKDRVLTTTQAAAYANITEEEFMDEMKEYDTTQAAVSPA